MCLIFPAVWTGIFWFAVGFIVGDYSWVQHAPAWHDAAVNRAILVIFYLFGALLSFVGGAATDAQT